MTVRELTDLAARVLPVLALLVTITVVAEIADLAGVFDVAAHWAARAGRHRVWALWLLVVAIACGSTIVLSLDTTAVHLGRRRARCSGSARWAPARPTWSTTCPPTSP
jgi:arsenical pump membrane protein